MPVIKDCKVTQTNADSSFQYQTIRSHTINKSKVQMVDKRVTVLSNNISHDNLQLNPTIKEELIELEQSPYIGKSNKKAKVGSVDNRNIRIMSSEMYK